jgi:hypothetical protein
MIIAEQIFVWYSVKQPNIKGIMPERRINKMIDLEETNFLVYLF